MPWKEFSVVNERMKFVMRLEAGEKMADLCREFGISRPTGYKFFKRYKEDGPKGLYDFSKKPNKFGNAIDERVLHRIIKLKEKYPSWGAPKIQEKLKQKYDEKPPAISTIHSYFEKLGLVKKRKKRRYKAKGTNLRPVQGPNDLWCCDYKGQFRLQNQKYCFPLTITDQASRKLLCVEALESTKTEATMEVFKNTFREYGIPDAIRSDNGVPFASNSLFGLSRLNIMWLKQGIKLERIRPGKPQENGQHERMHLTLKLAATKPAGKNFLHQQEMFDKFKKEFNGERPHQALKMKVPSELYERSPRKYQERIIYDYGSRLETRKVDCRGYVKLNENRVFVSKTLRGEDLGLEMVDEDIWAIKFLDYNLGYIDTIEYNFTAGEDPFSSRED